MMTTANDDFLTLYDDWRVLLRAHPTTSLFTHEQDYHQGVNAGLTDKVVLIRRRRPAI